MSKRGIPGISLSSSGLRSEIAELEKEIIKLSDEIKSLTNDLFKIRAKSDEVSIFSRLLNAEAETQTQVQWVERQSLLSTRGKMLLLHPPVRRQRLKNG